jgi:hypothetical protein
MTERQLDVVYCEGWAPEARAVVGRMNVGDARARHERGEQYAVALTGGSGRPRALLEVAMAHRFARSWHFDEHDRRVRQFDYRVLADGQLFLLGEDEWAYTTPEQPDLDEKAHHLECHYHLDGKAHQLVRAGRGLRQTHTSVPPEDLRQPLPVFGDWLPLTRLGQPWEGLRATADPDIAEQVPAPWRPPAPMRPFAMAETFTPGTRFALPNDAGTVVVEIQPAGTLRLTSGRLVAADPYLLSATTAPFATTVAPGEYSVELAKIRFEEQPDHVRVAAAKVTISPEPVASWRLALRPGQDPVLLNADQFYGFGVDAGTACLVDADALPGLESSMEDAAELFADKVDDMIEVPEPESGANVIAFHSGWGDGSYPTWQGHGADGAVVAFVVDLLVVYGGEILP